MRAYTPADPGACVIACRMRGDLGDECCCCSFQIPPDLVVKSQGIDIVDVMCSGYDDYTSWTNGKSRREQPSPSEALRLPRNPGECGFSRVKPRWSAPRSWWRRWLCRKIVFER